MRSFITQKWPMIAFGEGMSRQVGERFKEMGVTKVLIVYDMGVYKTGMVDPIIESMEQQGLTVLRYDKVKPDVPDYTVAEVAKIANDEKIQGFLAIGGGSTMDTAKNAAVFKFCKKDVQEYFTNPMTEEIIPEEEVKLICIPTTAGTGAEMTGGGPVYNSKTGMKGGLRLKPKAADMAILDPLLTVGLPPYITATTGLDALGHAIESMTGNTRNPRTDLLCGQAIEYIWRSLPKVMENPKDLEARSEMALAANYAIGVEALRHLGHVLAHPLGGKYHLPHGHAVALALPVILRYVAKVEDIQPELRLIASKMGLDPNSPTVGNDIADAVDDLRRKFGIVGLKDKGFDNREEILELVPVALEDPRSVPNSPIKVGEKEIAELLLAVYDNN